MSFEILIGLEVADKQGYQAYRNAMMPILQRYGGAFGYDFEVSEVLKSETDANINRVFTIRFPSEAVKQQFFDDTEYLQVKAQYFQPSVISSTHIASYPRDDAQGPS